MHDNGEGGITINASAGEGAPLWAFLAGVSERARSSTRMADFGIAYRLIAVALTSIASTRRPVLTQAPRTVGRPSSPRRPETKPTTERKAVPTASGPSSATLATNQIQLSDGVAPGFAVLTMSTQSSTRRSRWSVSRPVTRLRVIMAAGARPEDGLITRLLRNPMRELRPAKLSQSSYLNITS